MKWLYNKFKARCFYCGKRVHKSTVHEKPHQQCHMCATRDHINPVKWGGKVNDRSNVVLACYECNQSRDKFHKAIRGVLYETGG